MIALWLFLSFYGGFGRIILIVSVVCSIYKKCSRDFVHCAPNPADTWRALSMGDNKVAPPSVTAVNEQSKTLQDLGVVLCYLD